MNRLSSSTLDWPMYLRSCWRALSYPQGKMRPKLNACTMFWWLPQPGLRPAADSVSMMPAKLFKIICTPQGTIPKTRPHGTHGAWVEGSRILAAAATIRAPHQGRRASSRPREKLKSLRLLSHFYRGTNAVTFLGHHLHLQHLFGPKTGLPKPYPPGGLTFCQ